MPERKLVKLEDGRMFDINAPWDGELKDGKFVKPDRPVTLGMILDGIPLESIKDDSWQPCSFF